MQQTTSPKQPSTPLLSAQMCMRRNRKRYDRGRLRYSSDLIEDEWALVAPLIPPAKRGGAKRTAEEDGARLSLPMEL